LLLSVLVTLARRVQPGHRQDLPLLLKLLLNRGWSGKPYGWESPPQKIRESDL
jgi:hypothetical protein